MNGEVWYNEFSDTLVEFIVDWIQHCETCECQGKEYIRVICDGEPEQEGFTKTFMAVGEEQEMKMNGWVFVGRL